MIAEYIVDFCCEKAGVIIELDGSQHCEADAKRKDGRRTEKLEKLGYRVIRIPNSDIHYNFEGVKEKIHKEIGDGMKRRGWET